MGGNEDDHSGQRTKEDICKGPMCHEARGE